jgi:hypothetical protein
MTSSNLSFNPSLAFPTGELALKIMTALLITSAAVLIVVCAEARYGLPLGDLDVLPFLN